jgi:adenine/guanine phosphoribosyltransferase-like PRPP-binding protein
MCSQNEIKEQWHMGILFQVYPNLIHQSQKYLSAFGNIFLEIYFQKIDIVACVATK